MTTLGSPPPNSARSHRASEMVGYLAITRDIAIIVFVIAWIIENI